ncbi:hypothetical protein WICPIJ_005796 [Wickerhamomyces pijperi]|uniref:Uncharacterized protein n=1 Tax=Wickerhamomyces pijperi TaxID=599730 RepID=A0A9P8TKS5_WICPI|nr:hypothetical protein WICPIJ_005796 [Wickerhamomyces pijperi]
MVSEITVALDKTEPKPIPGKEKQLLFSEITYPLTGLNGEPVATKAWLLVHSIKSSGKASCNLVGLDNGKTIGLSLCLCISWMICLVKAPAWVEQPIKQVGLIFLTTSYKEVVSIPSHISSGSAVQQVSVGELQGSRQGGHDDGTSTLDIIVETGQFASVLLQDGSGSGDTKIFEVHDWDNTTWVDTTTQSHQGQLGDGDSDTTDTLVTDTQDTFTVRDDNVVDVLVFTKVGQSFVNGIWVGNVQETTFWLSESMGVCSNGITFSWGVNDWDQLSDVSSNQFVE